MVITMSDKYKGEDEDTLREELEDAKSNTTHRYRTLRRKMNQGTELAEEEIEEYNQHRQAKGKINSIEEELNIRSTMIDDSRNVKYIEEYDILVDGNDKHTLKLKNPDIGIDGSTELAQKVLEDDYVIESDVSLDFLWKTNRTGFCEVSDGDESAVIRFSDSSC